MRVIHLRIHMPITDKDIQPPIIIRIKEPHTPPQIPRIYPQSRQIRMVLKRPIPQVLIQRVRIPRKIRLHNIKETISVKIPHANSHASLRFSVRRVRNPTLNRLILERPILLIPIESSRRRIIRHIDIRPPIVIQVCHRHAKSISPYGLQHPRFSTHIRKRPITIVPVKDILPTLQPRRPTSHLDPLIRTPCSLRQRRRLRIEIDIVRHKQIQVPILVIIQKRTPRVPPRSTLQQPCLRRHIRKRPIPVVPPKHVLPVITHKKIVVPIVVIVPNATTLTPSSSPQPSFQCHIRKRAIPIILEQSRDRNLLFRQPRKPT